MSLIPYEPHKHPPSRHINLPHTPDEKCITGRDTKDHALEYARARLNQVTGSPRLNFIHFCRFVGRPFAFRLFLSLPFRHTRDCLCLMYLALQHRAV